MATSLAPIKQKRRTADADRVLRILVVDDEPLIRWSIGEILTGSGHSVTAVGTAATAIDELTACEHPPNVAILDYRLPDSRGLELLAAVRERCPDTAVILITAESTPEMAEHAFAMGAICILNKPFDLHDLPKIVDQTAHCWGRT